jgi:hypothetical protein
MIYEHDVELYICGQWLKHGPHRNDYESDKLMRL